MIQCPNPYQRITLVGHPSFAGGHFLINCLGLNDQSVFQHAELAKKQIAGQFQYANKLQYLHEKLKIAGQSSTWTDLDLGNIQLLGIEHTQFCTHYHEILARQMLPVVEDIMNQNLHMMLSAHSPNLINAFLKFWPNARVIFFTNYRKFINARQQATVQPHKNKSGLLDSGYYSKVGEWVFVPTQSAELTEYWDSVKELNWPLNPPTDQHKLEQLPMFIQQQLRSQTHQYIGKFLNYQPLIDEIYDSMVQQYQDQAGEQCFIWDTGNNFKNSQEFLKNIKKCLDWLNLPATNDQDLINYFEHWFQVILD